MRLDGAIFAASNAALMLAQMGDEDGAVKEVRWRCLPACLPADEAVMPTHLPACLPACLQMRNVARRAPGSADMRAALAALYWSRGQQGAAEEQWEFACDQITVSDTAGRIRTAVVLLLA
jgi:hypothetical protein